MSENGNVECSAPCEAEKPQAKVRKKRDIFRFNGQEDMSINLEHVYKIVRAGKRITFQTAVASPTADFVEFESEDAAKTAFDQILSVWSQEVVEQ